MKKSAWAWAAAAILGLWLSIALVMNLARQKQATADGIIRSVELRPLASLSASDRAKQLASLADQVNRLSFEERRQLALRRGLDLTFEAMTDAERQAFLDRTLPQGFAQIIEVFNKMSKEDRQAAVERALDDLRRAESQSTEADWSRARARLEDGSLQKVVEQGFQAYLQTANAETKLDLAPVIEQIQQNVRALERR
jgi:hypothetical protein